MRSGKKWRSARGVQWPSSLPHLHREWSRLGAGQQPLSLSGAIDWRSARRSPRHPLPAKSLPSSRGGMSRCPQALLCQSGQLLVGLELHRAFPVCTRLSKAATQLPRSLHSVSVPSSSPTPHSHSTTMQSVRELGPSRLRVHRPIAPQEGAAWPPNFPARAPRFFDVLGIRILTCSRDSRYGARMPTQLARAISMEN